MTTEEKNELLKNPNLNEFDREFVRRIEPDQNIDLLYVETIFFDLAYQRDDPEVASLYNDWKNWRNAVKRVDFLEEIHKTALAPSWARFSVETEAFILCGLFRENNGDITDAQRRGVLMLLAKTIKFYQEKKARDAEALAN